MGGFVVQFKEVAPDARVHGYLIEALDAGFNTRQRSRCKQLLTESYELDYSYEDRLRESIANFERYEYDN
jgi:hypothetical protein